MELKVATKKTTVKGCWGKKPKKLRRILVPRLLFKYL